MNSNILLACVFIVIASLAVKSSHGAGETDAAKLHLAKRAITEWRFKRHPEVSFSDLFDVVIELRPKNVDGSTDQYTDPLRYKLKLVPDDSSSFSSSSA